MTTTQANDVRLNFGTDWAYAPAPESAAHVKLKDRYDLFIDGQFVAPEKGKYFDTINPSNEKKIAEVGLGSAEDVDKAVRAARRAYDKVWSKMPSPVSWTPSVDDVLPFVRSP